MIQFRRGTTKSWLATKLKLASGQPGYDKDKHKIKIGNGESSWSELPFASGLFADEILSSETIAKEKLTKDSEDLTLITYGPEEPDENIVGKLYLQQEAEADYVTDFGMKDGWTYRIWKSGLGECWLNLSLVDNLKTSIGTGLFKNDTDLERITYPINFIKSPNEQATLQSSHGPVWLAASTKNAANTSCRYSIIGYTQLEKIEYTLSLYVSGQTSATPEQTNKFAKLYIIN